jgi:sec-independent protein translocase protein TatA
MFDGIGPWQLIIVLVIILLLFGANRIPEMMRGLGGGVKEFKKSLHEDPTEEKAAQTTREEKEQGAA